jgi:hypothetical protein
VCKITIERERERKKKMMKKNKRIFVEMMIKSFYVDDNE